MFSLQSDYADNLVQQESLQKELRTLLQLKENRPIQVTVQPVNEKSFSSVALAPLLDSAEVLRPDVVAATTQLDMQQHNYSYQKALAVPDVTVGVEYDRANSYVKNYYGLQLALPLPLLNRNRGNIISAGWNIKQAQTVVAQNKTQVRNEILASYNKLIALLNVQKAVSSGWTADYNRLLQNMISSYQQRKVSLIDFIDFFSSYKDTKLKQLQQQTNLLNAAAEFNFVTNQNVIALK